MPAPVMPEGGDYVSRINSILSILGTTKTHFWPFIEDEGVTVNGFTPAADLIPSETSGNAEALEDDFSPIRHEGGVCSYNFQPTGDHHLAGADHANYSYGDGSTDDAVSFGAFIWPKAIASNVIIAKYDSAGNAEEYRFWIDASGLLDLELHDASASATEIAVSDAALTLHRGVFVVAAYDGAQATPDIDLYVDAVAVNDGSSTEANTYTAMESGAAPLTIGCGGVTATPTTEFNGRIAMPFIAGKQLSANEVRDLFVIYRSMLGY